MSIRCDVVRDIEQERAVLDRPTALVIPAYNEALHISKLLSRCHAIRPKLIVVVDDCSSDGTAEVLRGEPASALEHGVELVVLHNEHNLGKQGSVRRALLHLATADVAAVALIDGDGQHNPSELPALVRLLGDYDVVIGARSQEQMPFHRELSNALVNFGFLAIGGIDFRDVQSGLRVYTKEQADVLADLLPSEGGYGLEHESLGVIAEEAQRLGRCVRVAAAPTSCVYGEAKSKIKPGDVVDLAYQTFRQAWRIRKAAA